MTLFQARILALAVAVLTIADLAFADETNRFAVIQFVGTAQYPHDNQPIVDVGSMSGVDRAAPNEISETPLIFVVVADTVMNQICIYAKMSLWRLDTGTVDKEKEFLWHQSRKRTTEFADGSVIEIPPGMLWYDALRSIFVDVFELPISQPVDQVVKKIQLQIETPKLGESSRNDLDELTYTQRSVDEIGQTLVVNLFDQGSIRTAVQAALNPKEPREITCKSMDYFKDKPTEIRTGVLTLRSTTTIPSKVSQLLIQYGISDAASIEEGIQAKLDMSAKNRKSRSNSKQSFSNSHWSYVVFSLGCIAFALVLGFRIFHSFRRG